MICRKCGRQLPDTAKFCNGCGSPTAVSSAPERTAIPAEGMAVPAKQRKGRIIAVSAIAAVLLLGGGAGFLFREQLFGGKDDGVTQAELEKEPEDEEEETPAPETDAQEDGQSGEEAPDSAAEPSDADEAEPQEPQRPEDSRPDTPQGGDIFTPQETERPAVEPTTMAVSSLRNEMTFDYGEDTTDPVESGAQETPSGETDICEMFWFDTSQMKDFYFDGEFFVIEFRIKEDAPDGSYPVSIVRTDIGSWSLESRFPETIDGEVAVGRTLPAEQPDAGDAFTLTVGSVRGDQGDTVRVPVMISNNPGFVGTIIDVEYDTSVLEIVGTYSGEAFDREMNAIY